MDYTKTPINELIEAENDLYNKFKLEALEHRKAQKVFNGIPEGTPTAAISTTVYPSEKRESNGTFTYIYSLNEVASHIDIWDSAYHPFAAHNILNVEFKSGGQTVTGYNSCYIMEKFNTCGTTGNDLYLFEAKNGNRIPWIAIAPSSYYLNNAVWITTTRSVALKKAPLILVGRNIGSASTRGAIMDGIVNTTLQPCVSSALVNISN